LDGGATIVRTLVEQTETLVVLVTSRQRLNLAAEWEFPVAPLPVPEAGDSSWSIVEGQSISNGPGPTIIHQPLSRIPSVALFLGRAQAARPGFQLTPVNAAVVAQLCRRLEGLPLALELAAARISVLTPRQILERLSERFTLLSSRRRDVEPRHRSL